MNKKYESPHCVVYPGVLATMSIHMGSREDNGTNTPGSTAETGTHENGGGSLSDGGVNPITGLPGSNP